MLLAALLFAAVLTGNEIGTLVAVHPAVRTLRVADQVRIEQALTRRYLVIMPILMTGTVFSCFGAGLQTDGSERVMLLGAGSSYVAMLAITLGANMALNVATLRTVPDDTEVDSWRRVRRRWGHLHALRVALDAAGLALVCVAASR